MSKPRSDARTDLGFIFRIGLAMLAVTGLLLFCLVAFGRADDDLPELPPVQTIESDLHPTPEQLFVGQCIWFDKRCSTTGQVACASCHVAERGFSDATTVSQGVDRMLLDGRGRAIGRTEQFGIRRAMTAEDAMFKRKLFWDGRAELEQGQATQPFVAAAEMGQQTLVDVFGTIDRNGRQVRVGRLGKIQGYQDIFQKAFGNPVNQTDAVRALAMLERTFVHGEAPIDRHAKGETWVFDKEQERGRVLFFGDGHCSQCHYGASFADGDFHRILGATLDNTGKRDIGRGKITKRQADNFRFATPTLRDVAKRLPWGHGGQYATAEEFVEMLNNPPEGSELQPLGFSVDDRAALVYFLVGRGKTPGAFESYIPPFTSQPALPQ